MDTLTTGDATKPAQERMVSRGSRKADALRLLALGVVVGLTLLVALQAATDPDLWWHLATGRYILSQHRIPVTDIFSFTAVGHRWVTHEWLSDVLMYAGYRLVGHGGLALAFAGLVGLAFGLVFLRCRGKALMSACSVLLAASTCFGTWGVRPQMFTLLFASVYLYILERETDTPSNRMWLLAPLTSLWANLHSGFLTGLALIAAFAAAEELRWLVRRGGEGRWVAPMARRLVLLAIACFAASCLTPNGLSGAAFPFGTLGNGLIQANVREWASVDFHQLWAWPLAAYWLLLLIVLARSTRPVPLAQLLLLLGATAAGLYSARHVPFLALVGAPLLAGGLPGLYSVDPARGRGGGQAALARVGLGLLVGALAFAIGVQSWRLWRGGESLVEYKFPSAALAFMQDHGISGRLYNTYQWGGYLIWHGYQVFIDGRTEVYGDAVFGDYLAAHDVEPGWEATLDRYSVDTILIETGSSLAVVLDESGRWKAVYRDNMATVFVPAETARVVTE